MLKKNLLFCVCVCVCVFEIEEFSIVIMRHHFLAIERKNNYFLSRSYITRRLLCMYMQKNVILTLRKLLNLSFPSFQENILCKNNRYLLKEKK